MKYIERCKISLKSEQETAKLGHLIADALEIGDIVALVGDLGSGKTTLAKYIAEGLGIKEKIISPTFTILKLYEDGRIPLAHFDVYRLGSEEELWDIGGGEIIGGRYVSLIEWADKVAEVIPKEALLIHLAYGEKEDERAAEII